MGVHILEDRESGHCAMYCSTTDWAFGPVFFTREQIEKFLQWLPLDARKYDDKQLEVKRDEFTRLYICECGDVRRDAADCIECKYGDVPVDGKHLLDTDNHLTCDAEPEPAAGERYRCASCQRKADRKQQAARPGPAL